MGTIHMMDGKMMWGAGLLWLLLIVVLVLAAAALIKYLRSDRSR
jgi:type IV secretory pathway VirB2 component (pilin)